MATQTATQSGSATQALCRYLVSTQFERIPAAVVETTKTLILDSLANAIGGVALAPGREVVALAAASKGVRQASISPDGGYVSTPVYDRSRLGPGITLASPAIIAQPDTTTVVYPGRACRVDPLGSLVIEIPWRPESRGR